ncbi:unnamed protein product [Debaryomyces fabryi]|nr:unnamed protein product [Debaryomyces fabryi]
MMIKIIRPNVKIRVLNFLSCIRILSQNHKRYIKTTTPCTYKSRLGLSNIFSANNIVDPDSDSANDIINEYNDYSSIDDLQIRLKDFIKSKPAFVNAYNDYKKRDLSLTSPLDEINKFILGSPKPNFRAIVNTNENMPPNIGSFIEIINHSTSSVTFGVVLEGSQTKFNENYNKLLVLTVDNKIEKICPQDVSFHFFQVLDSQLIQNLQVTENRHDDTFRNRLVLVDILKLFIRQSLDRLHRLQDPNNNQFSIAFSQYATPFQMKSISLPEIYDSFKLLDPILSDINSSYYNQAAFLLSCHLGMINSPEMWLVTSCYGVNKLTNLVKESCSNQISSGSRYFVNSITNMESLSKIFDDFENPIYLAKYNSFLSALYGEQTSQNPKSFDDLNVYFNIWEGKHFVNIITVMKFFIIYPHSSIKESIERLPLMGDKISDPSTIYKFLEDLKIYNNWRNQMTDIYLSANIMGKSQLSQLSISSANDLCSTSTQNELHNFLNQKITDKFTHLRKSKVYYQDHIVYGLPFGKSVNSKQKLSMLGVSLEKINSRKYLINIHIPDLITKLSPSSNLFDEISSSSLNMKSLAKLINDSKINIFDQGLIDSLSFPDQNLQANSDWFSVGDASNKYSSIATSNDNVTCMTVSFVYNKYESNPFLDLEEKISFSFDSLSKVLIKNIDWNKLENCLNGVTEVSPFTLFKERAKRSQDKSNVELDDDDIHNMNFIFNVMKSHIKIRNLDGASNVDPSVTFQKNDSSNLLKELSIVNKYEDHEKVITKIESKSIESQLELSKSRFFINEIDKFVGKITSRYCLMNEIPIFNHHQDILESLNEELNPELSMNKEATDLKDEAYISHNNLFLPNYHSNSYFQTLIARDSSGYVSMSAYLIGLNYLTKRNIEVFTDENLRFLPLGLHDGYVKMFGVFSNYEVLLNQFQILSHIQQYFQGNNLSFFKDKEYSANIRQFSYLKRYGYTLNGPLSYEALNNQLDKISDSYQLCDHLGTVHKQFWTLKLLEQRLLEDNSMDSGIAGITYDCIITRAGYEIPSISKKIARGYCSQLNIETDIMLPLDREATIGNQIICDKVMFLDPIRGHCVLRESGLLH